MKKQGEIAPPRLPKRATTMPLTAIDDQATYENLLIADCALDDQQAEYVIFEGTLFRQVTAQRARLPLLQLRDVRFEACDLTGVEWEHASLARVEFLGCRLIGLHASEGRCEDLLVKGSNLNLAQLWGTLFKRARFESCNLSEASFQGADLSGATFDKCDLRGASFSDAKLVGADLRGSNIDGVRAGVKELQGAIVDPEQAIHIARLLGVEVRWD
jgi:uncharacterized protein YjbI with pentapeptide repeats